MYLNPSAAVQYSEEFLNTLELAQIKNNRSCHLALLLHLGFMLERCICKQAIVFDNETKYIQQNKSLFDLLKKNISLLSTPFDISVNDAELCYIIVTLIQYSDSGNS